MLTDHANTPTSPTTSMPGARRRARAAAEARGLTSEGGAARFARPRARRWVSVTAYLAGVACLLALSLWLTGGRFAYSLDDPYIHLAFAEGLASGHHGIHPGEVSSPSSSLLWPALLSLFTRLPHFELLPFVVNVAAMAATVWLLAGFLANCLPRLSGGVRFGALVVIALACNFWGMPFNGMEHSAQLLVTVLVTLGALRVIDGEPVPPTMLLGMAVGPFLRFENTSLLMMGAVVLVLRGHRVAGWSTLLGTLGFLAAALFLHRSHGLGWLPSSVLVKSEIAAASGLGPKVLELFENILEGLFKGRMIALWLPLLLLLRRHRRVPLSEPVWLRVVFLGGLIAAHLVAGRYDWYGRYEVYLLVAGIVVLVSIFRDRLQQLFDERRFKAVAALALGILVLGDNQLHATATTPWSARDVYGMHGQMHRIAAEHWGDAVGANDIGWVSFQNPHYVLDLWGLASEEARELRRGASDNDWLESLADEKDVDLFMIFESWFASGGPLPPSWEKIAALRIPGEPVQVAAPEVGIFLRAPDRRHEAIEALVAARPGLPEGVELEIELGSSAVSALR